MSWRKPKANVFESTADKIEYNPGDKAAIILKSPFQKARALAILEGPIKNRYYWIEINDGQGIFHLPISGNMTPNVAVHFLLMRGRLPGKIKSLNLDCELVVMKACKNRVKGRSPFKKPHSARFSGPF